MATETNAGGSLACPRCGKPATDLSIKIRKCTRCGCTLAVSVPAPRRDPDPHPDWKNPPNFSNWDAEAMLRLAVISLSQKLGIALCNARKRAGLRNDIEIITTEDLKHAAAANAVVTMDVSGTRVVVRFGA